MRKLTHSTRLMTQIWGLAKQYRIYWVLPLALSLLLAGLLVVASQGAVPFVYTFF